MNLIKLNAVILFLFPAVLFCQIKSTKNNLIQFSGVVVEQDSLRPVPYSSVMVRTKNRGTICDYYGFFSFVAQKSDTIEFAAIGYKKAGYIIPDTLSGSRYSLIQVLLHDTVVLKEIAIYPWPTKEHFKEAFLKLSIPNDDLQRAQANIAREEEREKMDPMPMDANMNYKYYMQQQYSRLYYAGQYPSISLLNPVAWAKFIDAWRNGDFKKK